MDSLFAPEGVSRLSQDGANEARRGDDIVVCAVDGPPEWLRRYGAVVEEPEWSTTFGHSMAVYPVFLWDFVFVTMLLSRCAP